MIPNKTEEQILYNQFKFYDLEASGFCSLPNFIKTNDRIGVVLPRIEDFEQIFNYFADKDTFLLNYKKFIHEILNFNGLSLSKDNLELEKEDDFIKILTDKIIYLGGPFALVEIVKNLEMNDFEGNKKMNYEEFLKVLQRCKIYFSPEETKTLFRAFDYFENGVVKYQLLISILLQQFWSEKKLSLSKEIYYLLTYNGKKNLTLNIMKKYFEDIIEDSEEKNFFLNFIDAYKSINKININKPMNQKDLITFLKFYNFGQISDSFFTDLIDILRDDDGKEKKKLSIDNQAILKGVKNQGKNREQDKRVLSNYVNKEGYENENERMNQINFKLREKFMKFGRKSIFNFLKHFKFYDNNTKCISKYDFSKVLKDFNIKLTIDEVDTIFKIYGTDKVASSFSYGKFFNDLILYFSSQQRRDVIDYIYETIKERAESLERELDINFLKEMYNAKNNYFIEDETDNKIDFDDCLELFHYSYKGLKRDDLTNNEFNEFYLFISLIIPSDEDFIFMISNEWRVPLNKAKNINNQGAKLDSLIKIKNSDINKNLSKLSNYAQLGENAQDYQGNLYNPPQKNAGIHYNYKNKKKIPNSDTNSKIKNFDFPKEEKEEALSLLTDKLIKRGLRGILYLYSQFLNSCHDVNKITFDDFEYVFKIQHINLGNNVLKRIFSLFNFDNYLDFNSFIRYYKKELNGNKLNVVEQAFTYIDTKGEDKVPLNVIKMKYNAKKHPDVLNGKIREDEKLMEFLDCFNLCYNILKIDNKENNYFDEEYVDFEIFANFYEYVSFIYPREREFQNIVNATWSN